MLDNLRRRVDIHIRISHAARHEFEIAFRFDVGAQRVEIHGLSIGDLWKIANLTF